MGISSMFRIETASMAGRTVARSESGRWPSRSGRRCGVMTADTGVMGFGCCTDQGVVVAACTVGRTDGDNGSMVGDGGRMRDSQVPVWQVAQLPDAAWPMAEPIRTPVCGVMTADAGVVGLRCCTDQGVVVAACATRRTDRDQAAMVKCGGRMHRLPGAAVAGRAVAASRVWPIAEPIRAPVVAS